MAMRRLGGAQRFAAPPNGAPVFFLAREQEDGDFCILSVDVFGKGQTVPVAALSPEHVEMRAGFVDDAWLDAAVARHTKLRATNGYVPPVHECHNDDSSNDNRPRIGFACDLHRGRGGAEFKQVRVRNQAGVDEVVFVAADNDRNRLYSNIRSIPRDVFFGKIVTKALPFRSVEILSTDVPDISSLALMFSTPPFFALRPLNVYYDTSVKEPAFNFEPAAQVARYRATQRRLYSFKEPVMPTSTTYLRTLCASFKSSGIAKTKDEALLRLRLLFAAEVDPPKDEDMTKAAEAEFASEGAAAKDDKDEDDKDKSAKLEAEQKEEDDAEEGAPVTAKLNAENEEETAEPSAKAPEDPAAQQPQPALEQPQLALPGAAAPVAQPPAQPAAQAPAQLPAGTGASAAAPNSSIKDMLEAALGDVLAPLVQEVRGLLSTRQGNGAPGVDQNAPLVAMRAALTRDVAAFAAQFRARHTGTQPPEDETAKKFEARLAALESKMTANESMNTYSTRVAMFTSMLEEEERKSAGSIALGNIRAIAEAAAAMPDKLELKAKDPRTGRLSTVFRDAGELHVRQVLAAASAGSPPPRFGEEDVKSVRDQDIDAFAHNTKAFSVAVQAARDYDNTPALRKATRSGRAAFVAAEVFAATGVSPKS